uniref:Src homology 2 domain containing transforming protein D n=1 Tax=Leptobrachium leishanense TaxID=445787 RepID=A0A8C5MCD8_9ANUR
MAKWFKEYLGFGSRRSPPQPPKPDYTESEILRAYKAQKNLDFEDPYEEKACTLEHPRSPARFGGIQETSLSPRKRLIKVEQTENHCSSRSRLAAAIETDDMTKVTGGSEYSDPFDVTNKGISESSEMGNASYMEPYEHQEAFTGIQSPTKCELDRGLQLYDCPYEERYQGFFQDCRQPSDDERPADEYDQPWEWKKEGISRAFAEQFVGSGWQHRSPTSRALLLQSKPRSPDTPQRKNTSYLNMTEKESGSASKERLCALGDPTNINSSLHRQEWYHGTISHEDAEKLLSEVDLGSFLLRTENGSFHYISVRGFHSILHIKVTVAQDGRFQLADSVPSFSCILDLIQHYIQNPLLVSGERQLFLQCPVSSIER